MTKLTFITKNIKAYYLLRRRGSNSDKPIRCWRLHYKYQWPILFLFDEHYPIWLPNNTNTKRTQPTPIPKETKRRQLETTVIDKNPFMTIPNPNPNPIITNHSWRLRQPTSIQTHSRRFRSHHRHRLRNSHPFSWQFWVPLDDFGGLFG